VKGAKPKDVAYEYTEQPGWSAKVAELPSKLIDDHTLVLWGKCPHCKHEMAVEVPLKEQAGGFSIGVDSVRGPDIEKIARCNCGTAHEGRPDDVKRGCGAFGRLEVALT
jgi:hypothetical protein